MRRSPWLMLALAGALLGLAERAAAAPPQRLAFQGQLTDDAGAPLDGDVAVTFRLFTVETGGTPLWEETLTVTVDEGLFSVQLGGITPLTLPFDTTYFLELQLQAEPQPLSPRQPLAASPYAFRASQLQGLTIADGNVGIGTTTPSVALHVAEDQANANLRLESFRNSTVVSTLQLLRARGTQAAPALVANGDHLGRILFIGHRGGSATSSAAAIRAYVDGTPSTATNDMPGRLVFETTPDGTTGLTERLRITSAGRVGIGTGNPTQRLDVNGAVRLVPISRPATPAAGTIYFDTTRKHFFGFDGTTWKQLDN
jgi:hypothetical protein